ncbi:NADPH dehydrogenase NamA [Bacillus mangrovi]|uniref:NADPH dehydrogenase n=1 Tax=Metabacillus mangrovi TaxID=1491830 RepID=A0A7X2V317_9BACI|nr:NADPH dehydrogenase NamA [Metabacillus mangrovi]MTH52302.1 NADPH dehydrogenase NamA [Metabacillus mangrovi]
MNRKLFEPYRIKDVELKNRIVMSPMCMYSSMDEDGKLTPFHFTHYISRAAGQTGLIMLEASAVTPQGRISPQDLGIWSDEHTPELARLVKEIKSYGSAAAIQLAHAGRKAVLEEEIASSSALAFNDNSKRPVAMTIEKIQETIQAFRDGARRSREAGFDIIEIHGAHGYLINQFLSPLSNHRDDEYGGSAENRYRFLKEVIDAVKTEWSGPLFVRVSATDYHPEGLTPDDHVLFAKWMKEQGVDLIDVSSGALVPADIPVYPGYQVPFADKIRREAGIATGAVGMITHGLQAEEILRSERADLIFVARELLRDPYWPRTAASQLGTSIEPPVQYERGWK